MRKMLSLITLVAVLSGLAGTAWAGAPATAPATALVHVTIASDQDLDAFRDTGLPAYTPPWGGISGHILTGADTAGQQALAQAGLAYRVLDPDMAGAAYYLAYRVSGPAPDWSDYGRLLLSGDDWALLRTTPGEAERLALAGGELQRITLDPKPLDLPSTEQVFPSAITPDPVIQYMMDQVTLPQVYTYTGDLSGEWPVTVGGEPYTILTRNTYSGTPIQKATQFFYEHLQGLGLDMEYHQWGGSTYPNVIGEIPGLTNPDDIFIICAHIDDMPSSGRAPGADDNASGVVAVMLAADILSQYQWGCTLRFAAWTGEEQGLNGSHAYAQRSYNSGENIVGVLNLDMIAWDSTGGPDIDLHADSSIPPTLQLAQLFADVVDAYDLNLIPEIVPNGTGASDHASFWEYGYTAILGIEDFSDFNAYYHTSNDLLQYLNMPYYTDFVKASVGTFAHMSGCLIPAGLGAMDGHVTVAGGGGPISGATVTMVDQADHAFYASTDGSGYYTRTLLSGTYVVTASHPQYETASVSGVPIVTGTVTTQDFELTPRGRLWGYVTDLDNGFPLAATISGDGLSAETDPATGYYELYLDAGSHLVSAGAANYASASATVSMVSGQSTRQDFALAADISFIPQPVHVTLLLNTGDTAPAQLLNRKGTAYPFELYEIPGGFLPGLDAAWPGPDGYGYTGETLDYEWLDIRATGTPVPGLSDDSYAGPFNLGFTFPFYGANQTQFYIGSNGHVTFGSGSSTYTNQCPLPNSTTPNNLIALMWDDLYPNYTSGGVYYQAFPTCPVGGGACVVVEYYNWAHCCSSTNIAGTFEAILFDNGSVWVQYQDGGSEQGSSSTEGLEGNNAPSNHGLTYACDTGNSVLDGLAICYIYPGSSGCVAADVPWLGELPTSGTVPAGGSLNLTLYFTATAAVGVTEPGDYYATLVVNGSPKVRVPVTMTVVTEMVAPVASFVSSVPACENVPVVFTNTSDLGIPPADQFLWAFGDGITSTLKDPTHLYAAAGGYTVTMELCNLEGCDTAEGAVEVLTGPEAGFTFTANLLTVTFTNTSQDATAYLWAFGDGETSAETDPVHTYAAAGTYTVTLTVYGCGEDTFTAAVTVVAPPVAGFAHNAPVCLEQPVVFTNTSTGAYSYTWDFGDGQTSTETNPVHLYAAADSYEVGLEACNEIGCSAVTGTVTILPLPAAGFTFAADLLVVTFTNSSQNAVTYLWAFGDGITSTLEHPVHTYAAVGSYTVTLEATGACGTDEFVALVTVSLVPLAFFQHNAPVCLGAPVVFTNTSVSADTFLWTFGDGATSTETHALHTYALAGDYAVTLEACRGVDCDTVTGTVAVLPQPEAAFSWAADLLTVTFANVSQNAAAYAWALGDGVTSTEANPVHTYAAAGTYTVVLTATGVCGSDTITHEVAVSELPAVWAIYLPIVVK